MPGVAIRKRRLRRSKISTIAGWSASHAANGESGFTGRRPPPGESTSPTERLKALAMINATIFAPSPLKSLQAVVARYRGLGNPRGLVGELLKSGELRKGDDRRGQLRLAGGTAGNRREVPRTVRLLAPFDPVVWDRTRFEHLWGWQYRFEAYTPVKKRVRGYYAMPMLWRDRFVGWANLGAVGATGALGAMGASGLSRRSSSGASRAKADARSVGSM